MGNEPCALGFGLGTDRDEIDAINLARCPEQRARRPPRKGVLLDTKASRRELALQNLPNFGMID